MSANLTPEYERADRRFRAAATDDERLDALCEMLRTVPKHKGTEKIQADIKRRISRLRKAEAKKGKSRGPDPYHIPKSGAGQVVLIGPPNVGKSMLVAATTNAPVKVAEYPYTTALPAPGMWPHEDVQIELVDTPPVTEDHVPAGLMGTIRSADVIAVVVDASGSALEQADATFRLLSARKLTLVSSPRSELDPTDPGYHPGILIANKVDAAELGSVPALRELYEDGPEILAVSATMGQGLDALRERLWVLLDVVRVYTKQPGKPTDHEKPFVLAKGSTVEDLAREIHRELPDKMKFARLWGHSRNEGQRVSRDELLGDRDVVEIHE
jgi:ribosome-interacting GTPase 1